MRVSLVSSDEGLRSMLRRLAPAHSLVLVDEPVEAELLIWDFAPTGPPPGWTVPGVDHLVLIEPGDAGKVAASGGPPGMRVVFKPIREADLEAALTAPRAKEIKRLRAERDALLQRLLRAKARSAGTASGRLGPATALLPGCQRAV